ncbi:MAG: alpha-amylase family glycosyl hydrolase [Kofleriaceae bacterium]
MSWASEEGNPYPLGVTYCARDRSYNFALYSKHATEVRLLLFDNRIDRPACELALDPLRNKSGRIWHCRVPATQVEACRYYAYRVEGPDANPPFDLHAFHDDKLLVDPYARSIHLPSTFSRAAAIGPGSNLGRAALGELTRRRFAAPRERPHHDGDAVIYELHVRMFTNDPSSDLDDELRGTFSGVVAKIPHLRALGVTIVELMPCFQSDPDGADRWGYMPMSFFAPERRYAGAEDPQHAFRAMVDALHTADIEVVLDVVYSHTAEGGVGGPIYSFKGLDNSTYYLARDGGYADYAACGNSLNAHNRYVRKMIVDSMRHWVELGVDGFRFDLASVFARTSTGEIDFDEPPIFGDIASDPMFESLRMIAEPWDAAGVYELGRAFPGVSWMQWNSAFRDDIVRFVRGECHAGVLAQRIYGSDDLFPDDVIDAYHAYQSVNYVTCHDGFTLRDLVADRESEPSRGLVQARNYVALLMLANGTPMIRAGDEMLHGQGGRTNPYDVDDASVWIDWRDAVTNADFMHFVTELVAFRRRCGIGRSRFWRQDVHWFGPTGVPDFDGRMLAWCLHGGRHGNDLYAMVNGSDEPCAFVVQEVGDAWTVAFDTTIGASAEPLHHPSRLVAPRSIVVLERR